MPDVKIQESMTQYATKREIAAERIRNAVETGFIGRAKWSASARSRRTSA